MLIGMTLLGVGGFFLMPKIYAWSKSSYDRKGVEEICKKKFGDVMISQAITDEVMIVAYEYNSHEPRLFTKYTAKVDPDNYNVTLSNAAEASSAAPVYFDPKVIGN